MMKSANDFSRINKDGKLSDQDKIAVRYIQTNYNRQRMRAESDIRQLDKAVATLEGEQNKYRVLGRIQEWQDRKTQLEQQRSDLENKIERLQRDEENDISQYVPSIKKTQPGSNKPKSVFGSDADW